MCRDAEEIYNLYKNNKLKEVLDAGNYTNNIITDKYDVYQISTFWIDRHESNNGKIIFIACIRYFNETTEGEEIVFSDKMSVISINLTPAKIAKSNSDFILLTQKFKDQRFIFNSERNIKKHFFDIIFVKKVKLKK